MTPKRCGFAAAAAAVILLPSVRAQTEKSAALEPIQITAGDLKQVMRQETPWGTYFHYIAAERPRDVLVVVHGQLGEKDTAQKLAERFVRRWTEFADKHELVVISPAFDRANYQRAYGGYRGLFGRRIGADEFVIRIVDRYRDMITDFDGRFLLYGHSAGGQFACRFAVRHADRVKKLVLSAPGRYAFPDAKAPWPYGMGRLRRALRWDPDEAPQQVDIRPDPQWWVAAASLPIAIVIGREDTEKQPKRPGHTGVTRIQLARNWSRAMRQLARDNGRRPNIRLALVDKVGHNSTKLTPRCQRAFEELKVR
jgi:pimeloyl-ACP methyl ester carboxylesterase